LILYALGIGFQKDPMNDGHFNFTYENAEEFQSFPTIAVVMGHRGTLTNALATGIGIPSYNPMMILHGEEKVEIVSPIEAGTTVLVHEKIIDL
jgi:peroxisomal enoyl-CoA hydratase 2